jgi:hypothetical protein
MYETSDSVSVVVPTVLSNSFCNTWKISTGVNLSGHETDYTLLSSDEAKNGGAILQLSNVSSWFIACLIN